MNLSNHPGCTDVASPCELNLTVAPTTNSPAPNTVPFATSFDFSSTLDSSAERKSTTSWGLSVKATAEAWYGEGVPDVGSTNYDLKISAGTAYNRTVSTQYNTYQGTTEKLTTSTGFADHIFYTEREMNVYFYPVLGHADYPANNSDCSQKYPTYVEFSVPDQVYQSDLDSTTLEWYQPVQEPGNILSYPGSENQLKAGFDDTLKVLTDDPPTVFGTDSSTTSLATSWTGRQTSAVTTGSMLSFSTEASFSYATELGTKGEGGSGVSLGLDISGNTSFNSLNVNTASLSASSGITVTKPSFNSDVTDCCLYDFASLVFGKSNPTQQVFQTT